MGWQRCQMIPKTLTYAAKRLIYIDIFYGLQDKIRRFGGYQPQNDAKKVGLDV